MPSKRNSSPQHRTHGPLPGRIAKLEAVGFNTRKTQGELAEAAFLAKAAGFGFAVAKPWGDSERYDFVLDSGERFWRVQVKSTQRFAERRYRVKASGCNARYTRDDIDFLVAYVVPENLWYVIPVNAIVDHISLRFYPQNGQKALLEKYREAWCQMACPRLVANPKLIAIEPCCRRDGHSIPCPLD